MGKLHLKSNATKRNKHFPMFLAAAEEDCEKTQLK